MNRGQDDSLFIRYAYRECVSIHMTRIRLRLLQHHLPLLALSSGAVALLYLTRPYKDVVTRSSFATAYPALVLLAATLLIGPWNLLRSRTNPISSDLRRDIGIWAGLLSLVHASIGQCVHMRGRPWLYYIYAPAEHHHAFGLRHDVFGISNWTGLLATVIVLLLLATSNDLSLRTLKAARWKSVQRWSYVAFVLAAVHTFGYQLGIEKPNWRFVSLVLLSIILAIAFQMFGIARMRSTAAKIDPARPD